MSSGWAVKGERKEERTSGELRVEGQKSKFSQIEIGRQKKKTNPELVFATSSVSPSSTSIFKPSPIAAAHDAIH